MSKILSGETFLTIIKHIDSQDFFENFMLVHKETFYTLSTSQKNEVIKIFSNRNYDVTGVIKKMQNCGVVQLNKMIFARVVNLICHSDAPNMLKEWLNVHFNEHINCDNYTKRQILEYLFSNDDFILNEELFTNILSWIYDNIKPDMLKDFLKIHNKNKICDDITRNQIIKQLCSNTNFNVNEHVKTYCYPTQTDKKLFENIDIKNICASHDEDESEKISQFFKYIIKHKFILESISLNCPNLNNNLIDLCSKLSSNVGKDIGDKYIEELFPDIALCDIEKSITSPNKPLSIEIPVIIKSNIDAASDIKIVDRNENVTNCSSKKESTTINFSSEKSCDVLPQKEEKCDKLNSESTIICTYASNDEHVTTLNVKDNQGKFETIVGYLMLHWGFDENDIGYKLYHDGINNRFVFMSNDDRPIFNFVYTA